MGEQQGTRIFPKKGILSCCTTVLCVKFDFINKLSFSAIKLSDYVHLDIVDPETAHEAGNDGETINVKSSDNLEFMNNSVEIKLEPDHYSKVDRVRFSKVKHAAGKDDTKKTENSLTQESQLQDDIGEWYLSWLFLRSLTLELTLVRSANCYDTVYCTLPIISSIWYPNTEISNNTSNTKRSVWSDIQTPRSNISNTKGVFQSISKHQDPLWLLKALICNVSTREGLFNPISNIIRSGYFSLPYSEWWLIRIRAAVGGGYGILLT